jgi:SAM-dependent methyltransferase
MVQAALAAPPPAVRALLAEWGRSAGDPRLEVDPGDEMFGFLRDLCGGDAERALCLYYQTGSSIARVLLQVLRWRFGEPRAVPSLLDFASGYGRVTRFLLDEVPAAAVTAVDVLPRASAFQRRVLGVRSAVSATDPAALQLAGRFAAIFVTSLFTHLPEARFRAWLAALVARLEPGGVLAFSTHDLSLLPPEHRPTDGFCFLPQSEIGELAVADYGSTWVDEDFVRGALGAAGPAVSATRLSRAVCNYQDLWVVVPGGEESFAGLALQVEPEVSIEECEVSGGVLSLRGWARARHGDVERVEVLLDDAPAAFARVEQPRPDVAAALGPSALHSGWSASVALPATASPVESVLLLRAVDGRGGRHVVWAGRLVTAALQARSLQEHWTAAALHTARCELVAERAAAAEEIARLRATVAGMRASRFWKLRDAWFAAKRALRLTDEA